MPTVTDPPVRGSSNILTIGSVATCTTMVATVAATKRTVATEVRSRPSSVITPPSEEYGVLLKL